MGVRICVYGHYLSQLFYVTDKSLNWETFSIASLIPLYPLHLHPVRWYRARTERWGNGRLNRWREEGGGRRGKAGAQWGQGKKIKWKWSSVWRDWLKKSRLHIKKHVIKLDCMVLSPASHFSCPLPAFQAKMMQHAINNECVNFTLFMHHSVLYMNPIWMNNTLLYTQQKANIIWTLGWGGENN